MKAISRSTLPIPRNWWIVSVIWTALLFQMATAYISPAPHSGWDPNRNKAKAQPVSKPASESSFAEPPTNIQVEDIFREEYRDWAKRYDKKIDMNDGARFENFKMVSRIKRTNWKHGGWWTAITKSISPVPMAFSLGRISCCKCNKTKRQVFFTF